jgi:hypothetical protein
MKVANSTIACTEVKTARAPCRNMRALSGRSDLAAGAAFLRGFGTAGFLAKPGRFGAPCSACHGSHSFFGRLGESRQPPALPREVFASPDHRQHSTHESEGGAGRRRLAGLHGSVCESERNTPKYVLTAVAGS